jgi:protein-disulfide isomerase
MKARNWILVLLAAVGCGGTAAREEAAGNAPTVKGAVADSTDPRVQRADLARIRGDTAAKVWLVIVSDFQCPFCKRWFDETAPIVDREYVATGKIRVAYVNFPIASLHSHAEQAAEAAMCAGAQGKFWEYHDRLFQAQGEWAPQPDVGPYFDRLAQSLGLDPAAFSACTSGHVMRGMVFADMQRGRAAGVGSTPTFLVGNERSEGAWPIDSLRPLLDRALAAANGGGGGGRSR